MKKINLENKNCIIVGDLNIDGLKINQNNHVNNIFKTILEQNFIPTITIPTRIVVNQIALIDHIIINTNVIKSNQHIFTGNIYSDITDHLPNFIIIKLHRPIKKQGHSFIKIFGEKNMTKFKKLIETSDWREYYKTTDVNKALSIFYNIYNTAFYAAFLLKHLSQQRAKDKKWITSSLKACIAIKDRLFKAYKLNPTATNRSKHTSYKNILIACLRRAEDNYYKELVSKEKQNLYTLSNIFGDIINPLKAKKKNHIDKLIYNNKTIMNNKDISNTLNEHFCTIGEKLASKHTTDNMAYQKYLKNLNPHSLFLNPTDEQETLQEINKLNPKKSNGHDNVSPKLIKECNTLLALPMSHIINLSFENATIQDILKIVKVIPIYKKNEKYLVDNYRPISLLSTLNKIMEKLMYKRVIQFLTKYKILYKYQFGL